MLRCIPALVWMFPGTSYCQLIQDSNKKKLLRKLLLVVLRTLCRLMSVLSTWKLTEDFGIHVDSKKKESRINPSTVILPYMYLNIKK